MMQLKVLLSSAVFVCCCLLSTGTLFAQKTSIIHLKVANQAPFTVDFGGMEPQTVAYTFTASNVPARRHRVKIYQRIAGSTSNAAPALLFDGELDVETRREIFAYLDENNRMRIHQIVFLSNNPNNPYLTAPQPQPTDENPQFVPEQPNQPPYIQPALPATTPLINSMPSEQFNSLRTAVKDANFDEQRLAIAQQGIKGNVLSVAQVRSLIDVCSFEASKVELAKFAYAYTADKGSYHELYSAFTFSSSTDELIKYTSQQR